MTWGFVGVEAALELEIAMCDVSCAEVQRRIQ